MFFLPIFPMLKKFVKLFQMLPYIFSFAEVSKDQQAYPPPQNPLFPAVGILKLFSIVVVLRKQDERQCTDVRLTFIYILQNWSS